MPNFSFSTASNFLRFTPESLDAITKRIAEKKEQKAKQDAALKEGREEQEQKTKQDAALTEGRDEQFEEENIQPQLDLKVFTKLPSVYGKPPPWLIGEPLEDLDPYYRDHETFMVLSSRTRIFRFTATKALFLFSPFHPLRRLAIKIGIHLLFIIFITSVVLVNCGLMAASNSSTDYSVADIPFIVVYTAEFVIKVVSRGFVLNEFTYLRDPWNCLDFFVLIMTYAALNRNYGSISALRIFRVLRTLKAVSVIPGLQVIIASLLHSIKKLADVMLLTVFCLAIFALIAVQLFMGNLKYKCVLSNKSSETLNNNASCDSIDTGNYDLYYKMNHSSNPLLCGFTADPNTEECPKGYICNNTGDNPDYGYTSFDSFGWAFLSLFRLMTQDSWEVLYRQVIRTSGKAYVFFFVVVIFLCSFYLFNLILAVVILAYEEENKATLAQTKAKEMLLQIAKEALMKEQEMAAERYAAFPDENIEMSVVKSQHEKDRKSTRKKRFKSLKSKIYKENKPMFFPSPDRSQMELKAELRSYNLPNSSLNDPFQRHKFTSAANVLSKTMEWEESKLEFPPGLKRAAQRYLIWDCCPLWLQMKERMKKVMINPCTELFITLCIIINTLFMALEGYPIPRQVVNTGNWVFTGIFAAEMILKIIAFDPYYYFQEAWNIFDFLMVIVGFMGSTFLRLLRIFKLSKFWPALNKLMKIMFKSVGPLSNLTLVLIFTIFIFALVGKQGFGNYYKDSMTTCTHCNKIPNCASNNTKKICRLRWHMEDFLHSFLIIFRILCREWIETMWDCMEVTKNSGKTWCIGLFMLVLVIGNLVVLNLFIALLLNSFSSNSLEETEADTKASSMLHMVFSYICKGLQTVEHWLRNLCCNVPVQKEETTGRKNKHVTIAIHNLTGDCVMEKEEERQENCVIDEPSRNCEKRPGDGKQDDFMTHPHAFVCVPVADSDSLSDVACAVSDMDYNKQENHVRNRREHIQRSRGLSSPISDTFSTWSLDGSKRLEFDTSSSECSTVDQLIAVYQLPEKKEPKDCFPQGWTKFFPCCTVDTSKFPGNTWWRFRKTCYHIIQHPWFECFIIYMILLSSLALAFEDIHLAQRKVLKNLLGFADKIFLYFFFLEMLLKWVAYGFRKYFSNGWCWLDFFIVCVSSAAMLLQSESSGVILCGKSSSIKSLRTLRALRPLRALSRFKGIKVVVNALLGAAPSIVNVLFVSIVLWLPFNILGVRLFREKFGSCNSINLNKKDCILQNFTWNYKAINFDHVANGYLALLQVATFKGWTDIMYAAVDAPAENDMCPCFERSIYAYLYFVAFIIFGSFFLLNLFIGVVIDNFNRQRKKISGEVIFLSEEQKKYYNALKKLGTKKPQKSIPRPLFTRDRCQANWHVASWFSLDPFLKIGVTLATFHLLNICQGFLFDIVNKQAFDAFIISLILLNMVVMAVEHEGESDTTRTVLQALNWIFVGTFTVECVMKLLALRLYFFKEYWNTFDLVVVILSIASSSVPNTKSFPPTILRTIRVVRISRLLRLVRQARGLRSLLFALLMSLPALFNIGLLLFLIMFIYAIFGMTNFACASWTQGIDNIFNFQTFGSSMLCLFQITTSAGWNGFLNPMLENTASSPCAPNLKLSRTNSTYPCVDKVTAIAYFVSYIIISFLIVINMYIAVIIENFNVATEESTEPLSDDDFDIFYEIWAKFDPQATQFIAYSVLSDFADTLEEPLRIPKPNKEQLTAMNLPMVNGNKIHCLDILFAFTKRVLGESGEMDSLESQIEARYMEANPGKNAFEPIVMTPKRREEECAIVIQRAFRMHLYNRHVTKDVSHQSCAINPSKDTSEEQGTSAVSLNEKEGSHLNVSQSPSSISIPPSYSNVTGIPGDIPEVKGKD